MIASLSVSTLKQYKKPLEDWWKYCCEHEVSPFKASALEILNFLANIFGNSKSYGTINTYRSAISLISVNDIGKDSSIKRFCKGVSSIRPQMPKYDYTWEPSTVITYLSKCFPNETLSLEIITKKLVTLFALITAQRVQTLSKIKIKDIKFESDCAQIFISERIKTSGVNRYQPVLKIPAFHGQENICALSVLKEYIKRTSSYRNEKNIFLFLTFKKPYHTATSQSISRWIKDVLELSGIDTNIFSAHSTRHASTSAASRNGVSIESIRKAAGWTESSSVFARFYNRPIIDKCSFANSIMKLR